MIKKALILTILLGLFSVDTFAKSSNKIKKRQAPKKRTYLIPKTQSGLGVTLGNEVGVNYKMFLNKKNAYSATFAQKGGNDEYNYFHIDRITHNHTFIANPAVSLYYGIGFNTKLYAQKDGMTKREHNTYGIRFPFGVTYIFRTFPIDVFAELTPTLIVSPDTELEFNFFSGTRLWF